MFVLGIETATPWGSMALWEDGATLCEMNLKAQRGGGELLLATLADWLPITGKKLTELDLIAVGQGPGSYTGIRIGMAMANGLAEGLGIPVRGVNTLRVIADNACYNPYDASNEAGQATAVKGCEWVAALIDARRGEVYAALFRHTVTGLDEVIAPRSISAAAFAQQLAGRSVLLCGDGGKKYPELWSDYPNLRIAPPDWDRPQASRLARLAAQARGRDAADGVLPGGIGADGEFADRVLKPAYLKRVEAEVRWEEKCK